MRLLDALGRMVGGVLAPSLTLGSLTRNARFFHPDGLVYWARVVPIAKDGMIGELAKRLEGPALVRLSSGWWRGEKEWPDVLGIAMRFVDTKNVNEASPGIRDQDMLFATFKRSLTLPLAPLWTNVHDFMANDYHAVLPFAVQDMGRAKFRLLPMRLQTEPGVWGEGRRRRPEAPNVQTGKRRDKLEARIGAGTAVFRIEMKGVKLGAKWKEVAFVEIREPALVDQQKLAFSPFHAGRGIVPVGPTQMIRAAAYAASALGRRIARK